MLNRVSPFLFPGPVATANQLSIIHLKRDLQIPLILREHDEDDEGYAEGKVLNTRFGNFPHRTLIGLPWGSQVRASKVDTGSRGRRKKIEELKRKREEDFGRTDEDLGNKKIKVVDDEQGEEEIEAQTSVMRQEKEAVAASSGFIHILPPTPENWTSSLPHRTQVVYTPDYSYILHRLRARPGSHLIEAGAGSGSFTHASARAVFNGYPETSVSNSSDSFMEKKIFGKVWSFEFHEQRYEKLQKEIQDHGLEDIVQILHRDVYTDGFLINENILCSDDVRPDSHFESTARDIEENPRNNEPSKSPKSPLATAVFLDLPAPWLALPHLTRSPSTHFNPNSIPVAPQSSPGSSTLPFVSALDPSVPVHICTFSPCIEQVQRTVSAMRRLGWVDIQIVDLSHKRYEVRRERIGLSTTGAQRGLQMTAANVDEAVARLIEVEGQFKTYHEKGPDGISNGDVITGDILTPSSQNKKKPKENKTKRETILKDLVQGKSYKEGRLVHRPEAELKTHTSYLVFAVLPQEWSDIDEEEARKKWPLPQ